MSLHICENTQIKLAHLPPGLDGATENEAAVYIAQWLSEHLKYSNNFPGVKQPRDEPLPSLSEHLLKK